MKKISILLLVAMLLIGGTLSVSAEQLDSPNYPPKAISSSTTTVKTENTKTSSDTLNWDQKGSFKVYTGKTYSLKATDTKDRTVTYASSDTTKLTIDKNGKITPLKAGTVTISATVDKTTIVKTLTVVAGVKTVTSTTTTPKSNVPSGFDPNAKIGDRKEIEGITYFYDRRSGWKALATARSIGTIG